MKKLVFGQDSFVSRWVSARIPGDDDFPPNSATIGLEEDGRLIAGVVYTHYSGSSITMSVAADKAGWLNRPFLRAAFDFPFNQLGVRRVSGLVRTDNLAAQRFDEHLGFKREGLIREGDDDGCDLILYGMLKSECRWIRNGKEERGQGNVRG